MISGSYEDIKLEGHIIDSLLLPRVLDDILERDGEYRMPLPGGVEKGRPILSPSCASALLTTPSCAPSCAPCRNMGSK